VINYDMVKNLEDHVHRIGRTGYFKIDIIIKKLVEVNLVLLYHYLVMRKTIRYVDR
jgi:superfamily II DNA/RNA helicase